MPQIRIVQNFHSDVSDKIYFWTATINQWFPLLQDDENKQVIVNSLKYLSDGKYISVFGFVMMPTHIHLIWKQNKLNGKETPQGSFLKYTAHILLDRLMKENKLAAYVVDKSNKRHEIWQNNPLGIEIFSKEMALQKLNYVHYNPISGKWKLAKDDLSYFYSSARFYETGIDEFGFLNNIFSYFSGS